MLCAGENLFCSEKQKKIDKYYVFKQQMNVYTELKDKKGKIYRDIAEILLPDSYKNMAKCLPKSTSKKQHSTHFHIVFKMLIYMHIYMLKCEHNIFCVPSHTETKCRYTW